MLLFRDEGHVDRWCEARDLTRGATITPEQAWRLAYGWYKDKVQPQWRRHTVDEELPAARRHARRHLSGGDQRPRREPPRGQCCVSPLRDTRLLPDARHTHPAGP